MKTPPPWGSTHEEGVLYGKIHDATKVCIDGWGSWIASVCKGPERGGKDMKFQEGLVNVHGEGFRRGDSRDRSEAFQLALDWLLKTAKARGLELRLEVRDG